MKKVHKIYHYGGWGRNYGDLSIQYSMHHLLNERTDKKLQFIPIDLKDGFRFNKNIIRVINSEGSMLLVGGGGFIMRGDGFDTSSGWQFNIGREDMRDLEIPLVIYGIGHNVFPGDELPAKAKDHLAETQELAAYFSVRDAGTADFCEKIGLNRPDVIPDPAMFTPSLPISFEGESFGHEAIKVGLNIAGDRTHNRFGTDDYMDTLYRRCSRLLQYYNDTHLVLFSHLAVDEVILEKIHSYCQIHNRVHLVSRMLKNYFPERLSMVPLLAGAYSKMDIVFGQRGHSNIIPFGQGVPVVGVGNHQKNNYFAEQTYGDTIGHDLKGAERYIDKYVLHSEDRANKLEKIFQVRRALKEDLDTFNDKVLELL